MDGAAHVMPAQHGSPIPPQWMQVVPLSPHTRDESPQEWLAQHGCPVPPQAVHAPPMHAVSLLMQRVPSQQGCPGLPQE